MKILEIIRGPHEKGEIESSQQHVSPNNIASTKQMPRLAWHSALF